MDLDADGEPTDIDAFETRLEIKRGDDHTRLIEMINVLNDSTTPFESVMDRYFDAENVLTWVTVNALIHQVDAVTHNFYLHNPVDSDKFYFYRGITTAPSALSKYPPIASRLTSCCGASITAIQKAGPAIS